MDLTKELPFKVGDEIKNYKEMCKLLGERVRSGGAKRSQLARWEEYFNWEHKGYRFVITEILNKNFPTHDNNKVGMYPFKKCHIHEKQKHDLVFNYNYQKIQKAFKCSLNENNYSYIRIIYLLMGEVITLNTYSFGRLQSYLNNKNEYFLYEGRDIREWVLNDLIPQQVKVVSVSLDNSRSATKNMALSSFQEENTFCVYKFLNNKKEVIYVGRTQNLSERLYSHFYDGHLPIESYKEIERIHVLQVDNASEMALLELYYINKYKPEHNTRDKFDSPFYYVRQFELKKWEKLPNEFIKELKTLIPSE